MANRRPAAASKRSEPSKSPKTRKSRRKAKAKPRKHQFHFYLVGSGLPVVKRDFIPIEHLPRHGDVQNRRNVIKQSFKLPNQFIIGNHNYRLKQTILGGAPSGADKVLFKCGPVEVQWSRHYLHKKLVVRLPRLKLINSYKNLKKGDLAE